MTYLLLGSCTYEDLEQPAISSVPHYWRYIYMFLVSRMLLASASFASTLWALVMASAEVLRTAVDTARTIRFNSGGSLLTLCDACSHELLTAYDPSRRWNDDCPGSL